MVSDTVAPWAEPVLYTAEDLARLPEDGWRYELVQGRLVRMAPTGFEHSEVAGPLHVALYSFVKEQGLGKVTMPDTGFVLSQPGEPDTVLAPDLAFIERAKVPASTSRGFIHVVPDLVIEIASPSQHHPELATKARLWLAASTRLVWVIWPAERSVEVWEAGATEPRLVTDELDGQDVLPGFHYPLRELFPS